MADADEAAALDAARRLPLGERVAHRLWRARVDAFDDIAASAAAGDASDEAGELTGDLLAKGLSDTNAAALDKALDALVAWLNAADDGAATRIAPTACVAIAAKCLKQRPATVKRCEEAMLLFVEVGAGEAVGEALSGALGDRVPKVPAAALDMLTAAAIAFGPRPLGLATLFKALPPAFESKHGPVRDGAKRLAAELGAWLGAPALAGALLDRLPDAGRKGVEQLLAGDPGPRRASRMTRAEARAAAAATAAPRDGALPGSPSPMDVDGGVALPAAPAVDAFDFAEPVDVLAGLDRAWWAAVGAAKWSDRRDALRRLASAAAAPRLAAGDYGDVLRELRKVLTKDSNAACVAEAAAALRGLATGARRDLGPQARAFVPLLLDKLKDKNAAVASSASAAAEAVLLKCVALADAGDDVAAALEHKNPKAKAHALRLLSRVADATPAAALVKAAPAVLPVAARATVDASPDVREAALGALAAVCRAAGRAGPGLLDRLGDKLLDEGRRKKVDALVAGSGGRTSASGTGAGSLGASEAPPGAAAARPQAVQPQAPATSRSRGVLSAHGSGANGGPLARNRMATKAPAAKRPPSTATASDDAADACAPPLSRAEVEERLAAAYGQAVVDGLTSSDWKARLAAIDAIADAASEAENGAPPPDGSLVQCLAVVPGWGDANFQVVGRCLGLVRAAANGGHFGRADAAAAMPGLADKLADAKLRTGAAAALDAVAEAVGPAPTAALLHARAAGHRNPKVLAEAVAWLARAVADFGLAVFDARVVVAWLKADLASPTTAVRSAAVAALVAVRVQAGPGLDDALRADVKPALMATLEAAFAAASDAPPPPCRFSRVGGGGGGGGGLGGANSGGGFACGSGGAGASSSPPAVRRPGRAAAGGPPRSSTTAPAASDVPLLITPALLARLDAPVWQDRAAALGDVEDALRAGAMCGPGADATALVAALRARLADTNANLVARALVVAAPLASAQGASFERAGRPLLAPALAALADKKKAVRDGVLALLSAWAEASPADRLLPAVAEHVASPRCGADGRAAGLAWLAGVAGQAPPGPYVRDLLAAAGAGACDKAAAVRDAGVALAAAVLRSRGRLAAEAAAGGLAPRARDAALDALRRAAASSEFATDDDGGVGGLSPSAPGPAAVRLPAATPLTSRPGATTPAASRASLPPVSAATRTPGPGPSRQPAHAAADTPPATRIPAAVAAVPTPLPPPTPAYTDVDTPAPHGAATVPHVPRSALQPDADPAAAWAVALADLVSPDLEVAVEGMKLVCYELMDIASGAAPPAVAAAAAADADALVSRLAALVGPAFELAASLDPAAAARGGRACKYALNALMEAFQVRTVARAVSAPPLAAAAGALLGRLLDDGLPRLPDGEALLKALNVLMLRLLDGARPGPALCALLDLLGRPPRAVVASGGDAPARFADLVIKCLVKAVKALQAAAADVDLAPVLAAAAAFFGRLGPDGVRAAAAAGDRPVRMAKALLHELCAARGEAVRAALREALPPGGDRGGSSGGGCNDGGAAVVAAYVELHLATLAAAGPGGGSAVDVTAAAAAPPAAGPARDAAKAELAAIFRQIGARETSNVGLRALARFVRAHPEIDLAPHLAKTSEHFRQYIARGIARAGAALDAEAAVVAGAGGLTVGVSDGQATYPTAQPVAAQSVITQPPLSGPAAFVLPSAAFAAPSAAPYSQTPPVAQAVPAVAPHPGAAPSPASGRASTPSLDDLRARFERVRVHSTLHTAGTAAPGAQPTSSTPDAASVLALQERMRALRRTAGGS